VSSFVSKRAAYTIYHILCHIYYKLSAKHYQHEVGYLAGFCSCLWSAEGN
jgi:hypothetical protein